MKKIFKSIMAVAILIWIAPSAFAQASVNCTETSQFGSATINTSGTIVTISTCSFAGEFSPISGAVAGQQLKFISSAGDYITIHSGTSNGPIIAQGLSPLNFTNTFTGTIFAHWSLPIACGNQSTCRTTTVQCVSCVPQPPPANDQICGAANLACGQTVTGSTQTATVDGGLPFCGTSSGTAPGVWYSFTPGVACVELNTCNAATSYDTKISVFTSSNGTCSGVLSCVAGNDDDFTCAFGGLQSAVNFNSTAGTTYFVLVHGFSVASGNFGLTAICSPTPANDNACGAANIAVGGSAPWDNNCSSAQAGEVTPGAGSGASSCDSQNGWCNFEVAVQNSLWYTFTAPASGCVSISTDNTVDMQLAVYSVGNCADFTTYTELAANDDSGPGFAPFIDQLSCLTPGATYYVQLDGFSGAIGAGNISVTDCGNAPLAVDAGACQTVYTGYTGAGAPSSSMVICPSATGGSPGYSYSISPAALYTCTNGCFTVEPTATTTYTVTVTDSRGCTSSDDITIQVIDVTAACSQPNNTKVQICHVPPGNPSNAHEICVSPNAAPAHLVNSGGGGHDNCHLGPCNNPCQATNPACTPAPACSGGDFTVTISGGGFLDETTWTLKNSLGATVASGGPYGFGSTNSASVNVTSNVPLVFSLETQGTFNDNVANYSITCGGNAVASGTIGGGTSTTVTNVCCNGIVNKTTSTSVDVDGTIGVVAFPNPFNESTTFRFRSSVAGIATLTVFNMAGEQVAVAFNGNVEAMGTYEATFNGSTLSSGTYLYRFVGADGHIGYGKVNLMK